MLYEPARCLCYMPFRQMLFQDGDGVPCGSVSKEPACEVGDLGSIPGWERSPGGGHGHPLQYSCLESPQGQRRLAGYSSWGHKESDVTEQLSTAQDDEIAQNLDLIYIVTYLLPR